MQTYNGGGGVSVQLTRARRCPPFGNVGIEPFYQFGVLGAGGNYGIAGPRAPSPASCPTCQPAREQVLRFGGWPSYTYTWTEQTLVLADVGRDGFRPFNDEAESRFSATWAARTPPRAFSDAHQGPRRPPRLRLHRVRQRGSRTAAAGGRAGSSPAAQHRRRPRLLEGLTFARRTSFSFGTGTRHRAAPGRMARVPSRHAVQRQSASRRCSASSSGLGRVAELQPRHVATRGLQQFGRVRHGVGVHRRPASPTASMRSAGVYVHQRRLADRQHGDRVPPTWRGWPVAVWLHPEPRRLRQLHVHAIRHSRATCSPWTSSRHIARPSGRACRADRLVRPACASESPCCLARSTPPTTSSASSASAGGWR